MPKVNVPPAARAEAGNQMRRGAWEAGRMMGLAHQGGQGAGEVAAQGWMNHPMPGLNDRPMNRQPWMNRAAFDNPEVQAMLAANNHLMNRAMLAHMMAGGGGMRRFVHPALGGGMFQQGGMPFGGALDATARRHFWSRPPWLDAMFKAGSSPQPESQTGTDEARESAPYVEAFRQVGLPLQERDPAVLNVPAYMGDGAKKEQAAMGQGKIEGNIVKILSPGKDEIAVAPGLVYCRAFALHLMAADEKKPGEQKILHTVVAHFSGDHADALAEHLRAIRDEKPDGQYELAAVHAGEYDEWGIGINKQNMHIAMQNLLAKVQPGLEQQYNGNQQNKASAKGEPAAQELEPPPQGLLKDLFSTGGFETRAAFFHHTPEGFEHFSAPESYIKAKLPPQS